VILFPEGPASDSGPIATVPAVTTGEILQQRRRQKKGHFLT
jgi:hypothetical protein